MEEMECENGLHNEEMLDETSNSNVQSDESNAPSDLSIELNEKFNIEVKEFLDSISLNPNDYDSYIKLIKLYENSKDKIEFNENRINELRSAREKMSSVYPLTPNLWLNWLKDEIELKSDDSTILKLFERSINDYCSTEIWVEYLQFILNIFTYQTIPNIDLNEIFRRAISCVGLHPISGQIIYELYHIYLNALVELETDNQEKVKQLKQIFRLFQDQLSKPHQQIDETFRKFNEWYSKIEEQYLEIKQLYSSNINSINKSIEKSKNKFNEIISFETRLSEEPKLGIYYEYLDYELKNKDSTPNEISYLFERAITDHCLITTLWIKYINYLQTSLNFFDEKKDLIFDNKIFNTLERAIRNVNWCSEIWIEYLGVIERFNKDHLNQITTYFKEIERFNKLEDKIPFIQKIFEEALNQPFLSEEDYRKLWLSYLEFKKRETNFQDKKQIEILRKIFEAAIENLNSKYNADPYFTISIFQAKIEAKYCSNLEKSREIWKEIMTNHKMLGNKQVNYWLEYADLEKIYGNRLSYRSVMFEALKYCPESYELISSQLIKYYREECDDKRDIDILERKIINVYEKSVKPQLEKQNKLEQEKNSKRKNEFDKKKSSDKNLHNNKKSRNDQQASTLNSKSSNHQQKTKEVVYKLKPAEVNELQTILVKNLSYNTNEDQIREAFSKFGNINDIRLVRKYNGDSKGYCYIEYSSIEETRNAVKNDGKLEIDGRRIFIDEYNKKTEFKFSTGLEKNKLFVSSLPSGINQKRLEEIFSKFEGFKEVRLNINRNGFHKGNAYVDFKTDNDASRALLQTDGMEIDGKKISVEISNPPTKKKDSQANEKALGNAVFKKPLGFGERKRRF